MRSVKLFEHFTAHIVISTIIFAFLLKNGYGTPIEDIEENEAQENEDRSLRSRFLKIVTISPTLCTGDSEVGVCKATQACSALNGTRLGSGNCGTYNIGVCCLPTFTPLLNEVPVNVNERVALIKANTNFEDNIFNFPKMNGSCQLRLDFKQFEYRMPGPTGMCMEDSFSVTGSITVKSLKLCGPITRPLFLSYGNSDSIKFTFRSTTRKQFEVKVQHVDCNSVEKVDDHCLLNYNGETGEVESFGYGMMGYQIVGLEYNICVGGKSTTPTLTWEMCTTDNRPPETVGSMNSFYTTPFFGSFGGTDQSCLGKSSYVAIPGVGTFCGGYFPKIPMAPSNLLMVKTIADNPLFPATDFYPVLISPTLETPIPGTDCMDALGPQGLTRFAACTVLFATPPVKCQCTGVKNPPYPPPPLIHPNPIGFCLRYASAA